MSNSLLTNPHGTADAKPVSRIRQSVCFPMYKRPELSYDEFFQAVKGIGYDAVEMWNRNNEFDQICEAARRSGVALISMIGHSLREDGFNVRSARPAVFKALRLSMEIAAQKGIANLICFSGQRVPGQTDEEGLEIAAEGLSEIAPEAEKLGVNLNLELLNSKVDHKGYLGDHTAWAVEVVKRVNSPRVKVLYDIYHMQIMEGDVIRSLQDNIQHIGHIHTAGNPGRMEFDDSQELNYRGICSAISKLNYSGYVGHEFKPIGNPLESLARAFKICNV